LENILNDTISKELNIQVKTANPQNDGKLNDAGAIYLQYHQSIFRYLYYRTGDFQTAEDLTGDVFVIMVRSLIAVAIGKIPFRAWLFQVARNQAIDHYRHNRLHPEIPIGEEMDGQAPSVDTAVEYRLTSAGLARAIITLEDSQRDVLILRFIEQMPIAQVALVLHRSEDSIKSLQRRALKTLKIILESREVGPEANQEVGPEANQEVGYD